jgi:hypothetical protein
MPAWLEKGLLYLLLFYLYGEQRAHFEVWSVRALRVQNVMLIFTQSGIHPFVPFHSI